MKYVILWLLATVFLTGCMHNYDLTLMNGMKITRVSRPKLNKDTGLYSFKNIRGEKRTISASRVVEIAPHKEPKKVKDAPFQQ